MNTAIITPTSTGRHAHPRTLRDLIRRAAAAVARLRPARREPMDPRTLHELQREADRLRTENFRLIGVGRVI